MLQLIERQELDITTVSLAAVADQYLEHIRLLEAERLDAAALSDFLVVAARLLYIKSRALLPQPSGPLAGEEEEDPGQALVQQLREYRRFKQVAEGLRAREEAGLRSYPRLAPQPRLATGLRLEGISLADLLAAVQEALARLPDATGIEDAVPPLAIAIEDKIAEINRHLRAGQRFSFRSLLGTAASRIEIIVTFLALLELIRLRVVTVSQESLFGDIVISGTEQ